MKWNEFKKNQNSSRQPVNNYEKVDIECPICGQPIYRRTDIVFTSNPPKYQYECLRCGWSNYA